MKIELQPQEQVRVDKEVGKSLRTAALATLFAIVATVATLYVTMFIVLPTYYSGIGNLAKNNGHASLRKDGRILDLVGKAAARFVTSSVTRSNTSPKIVLDIKFKHMQKLRQKRSEAIQRGLLVTAEDDFVPATIHQAGRTIKAKVRLKGDATDHFTGKKWSLRIHIKNKDHIFGMRRFSIQHPKVRGFQGEILFNETLRHVGVLAPRYSFANVTINGENIGLMAVEEHFSKELLESNRRRNGVIIRFDESMFWEARNRRHQGYHGIFDDYRNTVIDAFQSSRIAESPQLRENLPVAVGLLRGFVNGVIPASEAFDPELMGRFLAVAHLWGSWHSVRWHNNRFYLNPITLKLEPIGFDASLQERFGTDINIVEPIATAILDDPKVHSVFKRTLNELSDNFKDGSLPRKLRQVEKQALDALRHEFYFLEAFPHDELEQRLSRVINLSQKELTSVVEFDEYYPTIIHSYLMKDGDRQFLELTNAVPQPIEVESIGWTQSGGKLSSEFEPLSKVRLPIRLEARPLNAAPAPVRIPFEPSADIENRVLQVVAHIVGEKRRRITKVTPYHPVLTKHPIPISTAEQEAARHPFIELDKQNRLMHVPTGKWRIRGTLTVPSGFQLTVSPGTTLQFERDSTIVAHGPVNLSGTEHSPVTLEGVRTSADTDNEATWKGIVVLNAGKPSLWQWSVIRNTSGVQRKGWHLTGGVTFFKSDIRIENSRFSGHRGEDALNVIDSKFDFRGLQITDTVSDAFDSDFSEGKIQDGQFKRIGSAGGGDAIDISGSVVSVVGTKFFEISDKALSVGEQSQMTARQIAINRVGTGAAAKDGSKLRISDATIVDAKHAGLMAYAKKPEFGTAHIEARNLTINQATPRSRAQKGSTITINGSKIESEDLNVGQLYETIMQPGLRK